MYKRKKYQAIDTTNDDLMIGEGLRQGKLSINRDIFHKYGKEKSISKKLKSKHSKYGKSLNNDIIKQDISSIILKNIEQPIRMNLKINLT